MAVDGNAVGGHNEAMTVRPSFMGLLLLAAAFANSRAEPVMPVQFEPLALGVWMHTSYLDTEQWGPVASNGLLVTTPWGLLLVDTAWTEKDTRAILDWTESRLGQSVTAAVLTHAHQDKMGGVRALRERGIPSWAHRLSNEAAPGESLLPADHDLVLRDGMQPLAGTMVYYPGPAHTRDNVVVYVPQARLLFGGCTVRPAGARTLGNTADADVGYWDRAVNNILTRFPEAETVVPSHGPPGGLGLLEGTIALVDAHRQQE